MTPQRTIPVNVVHLLPTLDNMLIDLLQSLTEEEWQKQTVAKLWTVKGVVAHLLDGNIRILSMLRDNYWGEKADANSYEELVQFLNRLNADWVAAMKRVSPPMLIFLHKATGPLYSDYYKSLNPHDKSPFAVNWAGEDESKNWMHIAREYTEKWLHQQQIRDAVNKPGLMNREFFYPFMDIFMLALPHTFRTVDAEEGTTVKLTITTGIGSSWFLVRASNKWNLTTDFAGTVAAEVVIDPDTAWKLFSKSLRPEHIMDKVTISGNQQLGEKALTMVSVMA
jgi:hypothetical protein